MTPSVSGIVVGLNESTLNNDNVYFAPDPAVGVALSRMLHQGQLVPAPLTINGDSSKAGARTFKVLLTGQWDLGGAVSWNNSTWPFYGAWASSHHGGCSQRQASQEQERAR